ncbi:MAG: hypothetical protein MI725_14375 [Pirellulales bacterium]|nr:hypothetical protein [Pirellulales bacterium]
METFSLMSLPIAWRTKVRRALSLLELVAVVAMLGVLSLAAGTFLGNSSLANGGAEGFAHKLSLALTHARRSTIATGDNHYLQLSTSSGNVVSYAMFRRDSGGDVQMDDTRTVPQDVTVTSAESTLEFDFEGSALASYSISVVGPDRSWNVSVVALTGAVQVVETTP